MENIQGSQLHFDAGSAYPTLIDAGAPRLCLRKSRWLHPQCALGQCPCRRRPGPAYGKQRAQAIADHVRGLRLDNWSVTGADAHERDLVWSKS
ncbi:MAG: hypothetical protein JJT96_14610 [Opitutales bacterium]|nr:hypothetical protein [Opitutales bacterium]